MFSISIVGCLILWDKVKKKTATRYLIVFVIFFMFQAIEAAIELNLDKVEAGAQGEHKIQRGYLPVTTYSSHYILDEDFKDVIAEFLERETSQVTSKKKKTYIYICMYVSSSCWLLFCVFLLENYTFRDTVHLLICVYLNPCAGSSSHEIFT